MAAITCELCGSNDVVKQGEYFVCQHCGTKYSLEEAKKLIGTVKVDKSDDIEKYMKNARRARKAFDWAEAEKYYNFAEQYDPENIEAIFYSGYSRLRVSLLSLNMNVRATQDKIEKDAISLSNSISVLDDYFDMEKEAEHRKIVEDAVHDLLKLNTPSYNTDGDIRYSGNTGFEGIFIKNFVMKHVCGAKLEETINNIIDKYKRANKDYSYLTDIKGKISLKQEETSKGCYVATAVYGSYDCPQVWTLRRYRDFTLAETWYGRAFIRTYYAISPTLVKWFGETDWFKNMWKPKLDKMVKSLNEMGVSDTPYQDRDW